MSVTSLVLLGIVFLVMFVLYSMGFKIVRENERFVVERFGAFHQVLGTGIHFTVPFIDRVVKKVDITEQSTNRNKATLITKDDKELLLEFRVSYIINNVMLYSYGVNNPDDAILKAALDVIRKEILKLNYEDLGIELNNIETNIKEVLSDVVSPWGLIITKINIEKKLK